jgi:N-acetyl-gamma-glutamyl-phosphate reductase
MHILLIKGCGDMKIFIDGAEGTTGLQLYDRLIRLNNINILNIDNTLRKNVDERTRFLNDADIVFLCLPDDAAREAVALIENPYTVVIDASSAHRTHKEWVYGLPELSGEHRDAILNSKRICVPGCHASGFNAIVYPLVKGGFITIESILVCSSLTGHTGGGKKMIASYEDPVTAKKAARPYALTLQHKHLPEMQHVCGLINPPIFLPIVTSVRQGMLVNIPLALNAKAVWEYLNDYYAKSENISVVPFGGEGFLDEGFLDMEALNDTDKMELFIFGHDKQTLVTARLDNLGKGAAGAAIQILKLLLGVTK